MLRAFSVLVDDDSRRVPRVGRARCRARRPASRCNRATASKCRSAALKGKVVMVNFWATWCVPCRQEMPHLQALYERYNSLGFELLAVNVEKTIPRARASGSRRTPVTFPVLFDPKNEVSKLYKVVAMPSTVLVGARRHDALHPSRLQAGLRGRVSDPGSRAAAGVDDDDSNEQRHRSFAARSAGRGAAARSPVAASSRG